MRLIVERFWWALLPLVLYGIWILHLYVKAQRKGVTIREISPHIDRMRFYSIVASFLLLFGGFVYLGFTSDGKRGEYVPTHTVGDKIIPGQVIPKDGQK